MTGPAASDPLCIAVQQAWQAGIVVVVAAGNDGRNNSVGTHGYGTISAPGNSPYAITVGAVNTLGTVARGDDKVTSYSSKGPTLFDHVVKPDLMAPGNRILSIRNYTGALENANPQNMVPISAYSSSPTTKAGFSFTFSSQTNSNFGASGAVWATIFGEIKIKKSKYLIGNYLVNSLKNYSPKSFGGFLK